MLHSIHRYVQAILTPSLSSSLIFPRLLSAMHISIDFLLFNGMTTIRYAFSKLQKRIQLERYRSRRQTVCACFWLGATKWKGSMLDLCASFRLFGCLFVAMIGKYSQNKSTVAANKSFRLFYAGLRICWGSCRWGSSYTQLTVYRVGYSTMYANQCYAMLFWNIYKCCSENSSRYAVAEIAWTIVSWRLVPYDMSCTIKACSCLGIPCFQMRF